MNNLKSGADPGHHVARSLSAQPRPAAARLSRWLAWLLRQRLVQFVVLGGSLLALSPRSHDEHTIALTTARVQALARREAERVGQAQPTSAVRSRVLAQLVEDEILVREARRLGLDQDDDILRRRLIQKALFLAEDLGGASRPLDEQMLLDYFLAHREAYTMPAHYRLMHVYGRDAAALAAIAPEVVAFSRQHPGQTPPFGDPLPIDRRIDDNQLVVEQRFGAPFAAALATLPLRQWSPPIQSQIGYHLVWLDERSEAHPAAFTEVRDQVRIDAMIARRQDAVAAMFARARERYRVTLDGESVPVPPGHPRTAIHTSPSMED
jgi:peptidyl-prolyl cis-trans isomerase C